MTYTEAILYLENELDSWNGQDEDDLQEALEKLNGSPEDKAYAMDLLNDLYWDSQQISQRCNFGQAVYTVSYTVDPTRPFPVKRPN